MKSLKTRDLLLTRLSTIGLFSLLFKSNEKTQMSSFVVLLEIQAFACYCMTSVFKTSLCNQFSSILGHLVYQHRSLRIRAYADT